MSLFEGIYALSIEAVASLRIGAFRFGGGSPLGPPEWSLKVGKKQGFQNREAGLNVTEKWPS